ncbi:SCO family protein [Azospirillum sp. B21]|uniref:SCO family protein n=1 Tax=unclassified Azospirillum TaxID=2630922 RepID=UPI0011EED6E5|nr:MULTISPECIES: SCO family protein [unclassified Azospirillum]KAA0572511.1 SCO family protein [Azospirillum sp. B21]MDR6775618.1 protein SCO1/2 [Azospirillum sp. BE72]
MNKHFAAATAALLILGTGSVAHTHSLSEVEHNISSKDKYVEVVNRPAPDFRLIDTEGRTVSLDDLKGKVVVLWFVYTSCPDVCPLHTKAVAAVQEQVNATPMKDRVKFVTISTDPARDTAKVRRDFAAAHGLDPMNSMFLSSGAEGSMATRELAEQYGLKFTSMPDGMQMHGAVMHLIDREGNLRARYHGMKFDPTNAIIHINALTNDGLIKEHSHQSPSHRRDLTVWERIRSMFWSDQVTSSNE